MTETRSFEQPRRRTVSYMIRLWAGRPTPRVGFRPIIISTWVSRVSADLIL
jgi:hypothetical protein